MIGVRVDHIFLCIRDAGEFLKCFVLLLNTQIFLVVLIHQCAYIGCEEYLNVGMLYLRNSQNMGG